jgi:uncharacterized protein (TIGR00251 family)
VIRQTADGIELDIRVIPRAGTSALAGVREGRLLVRLSAPPVEGAANEALIAFLSSLFHCPKRSIRIVSGERSRSKRVAIQGQTAAAAERLLGERPR